MTHEQVRFSVRRLMIALAVIGLAMPLLTGWARQNPGPPLPPPAPPRPAPLEQVVPPQPEQGKGVDFQVRAIDAATGLGISGVSIDLTRITPGPSPQQSTPADRRVWTYSLTTDAQGVARFSNVAPDRYLMPPPKLSGYALAKAADESMPASAGSGATPFTFAPGGKPAPVMLRMWKAASVDGAVEDPDGNPLPDVTVQIVEEGWSGGLRILSLAEEVKTDKSGKFVMPGVLPGTYYLRAIPNPGTVQAQLKASDQTAEKHVAFVDTLYPKGMYFEQASPLTITPGGNVFGLRIELQKSKYYSLSGRVFGIPPERQSVSGLVLMRRVSFDSPFPFIWASPYSGAISVRLAADGSFTAPNVPPGPYWAGYTPAGDVRGGAQFVIDDRNIDDFKFDVTRGAKFSGQVVFEDGSPVTALPPNQMGVFLPNMGVYQRSIFRAAGGFSTDGLPAGTWRLEFFGPVVIRSVLIDGKTNDGGKFDLTAESGPAVITLGRGGAAIVGSVELHEQVKKYVRGLVTVAPLPLQPIDNPKRKTLNGDASFVVEHLEPGRYRVCAWVEEGAEVNALLGNPRYEDKFNAACETVVLSANERKQVHLKQISAPEFR